MEGILQMLNHPLPVIASWTLLIIVILTLTLTPLPREEELGIRSVETRVSVAMYHAAHRVETYRKLTGHLPDYLEPEWSEAETIQYERLDSGYRITGKEAALTLTYDEGDDSERLLHYTFLKLGAQR